MRSGWKACTLEKFKGKFVIYLIRGKAHEKQNYFYGIGIDDRDWQWNLDEPESC